MQAAVAQHRANQRVAKLRGGALHSHPTDGKAISGPRTRAHIYCAIAQKTRMLGRVGRRRTTRAITRVGSVLERQLAERRLSVAEFARRAELSPSHVYQLLRGDRPDPRGT